MINPYKNNSIGSLKHILVPILLLVVMMALVYGATKLSLPEEHRTYETFFLILTALVSLFFMAVTLPCGIYGGYLAVLAIIREKKYVLSVITLLLDCGVLFAWVYFLREYVLM